MTEETQAARDKGGVKRPKFRRPHCPDNKLCRWISKGENLQVFLTVLSVFLGVILGVVIKSSGAELSSRTIMLIGFPGELLMNMLKMLIIPLIVSSLVSGLANLDTKSSGKVGSMALLYYVATTFFAVVLGIIMVLAIHPGDPAVKQQHKVVGEALKIDDKGTTTLDAFLDLFRNLFPENIVQAATQQLSGAYKNITKLRNETAEDGSTKEVRYVDKKFVKSFVDGSNVLGLVTFSIMFGMCIAKMGERARVMLDFFTVLNEIIMMLVSIIMWYAPIGIMFLICGKILDIEDIGRTAKSLLMYMITVISGLAIHLMVTLPLLYFVFVRKNPFVYFRGVFQAWVTALATGSSSATLPVTFRCLEENLKIDPRITRFVLPVGATVNMDGTALYEAVASIFIAQLNGIALPFGKLVTVSLTATLAAIGAASVPSAGLVTMVLVLTSVNLPTDDITMIVAVDWLLDRIRTSVNVIGDAFGAGIVAHVCRANLVAGDLLHPVEVDQRHDSEEALPFADHSSADKKNNEDHISYF